MRLACQADIGFGDAAIAAIQRLCALGFAFAIAAGPLPAKAQPQERICPESEEYESALTLFERADYAAAAEIFERAVDCDAFDQADYWLGRSYLEMGQPKMAIPLLESAVTNPEIDVEAAEWLASARFDRVHEVIFFRKQGFATDGRDVLRDVVSAHPDAARAHFMLASFYLNAPGFLGGGHDEAMTEAEKLAPLDPALYERFLAREAIDRKAFDEAAEHFHRSLELSPDVTTYQEAITFLIDQERGGEALALADAARSAYGNTPCFDLTFANAALAADQRLNEGRAAAERFNSGNRKYCSRSPSAIDGYFVEASINERLGDSDAASAAYTSVLGLDPGNRLARRALKRLGR